MKNTLLYNYSLDIDEINRITDGIYTFYIDYNKFYFVRLNRVKDDITAIYEITSKLLNKFHYIIKNNFNSLWTDYEKESYVLLKINGPENDEILLHDLINEEVILNEVTNKLLDRTNWGVLWSEKVDYLEYQISELGKKHKIATRSFSYYVGLAENAIQYFNLLKIDNVPKTLSRKRIKSPNLSLNFYNPLNLVIDYRVRDISEYIKSSFFEGNDLTEEIKNLVNKGILSPLEYNLLFARLLYPSYYFDDLTRVIEKNEDDEILLKYIDRIFDYEAFLKAIFTTFSKKSTLIKIDWLIKKEPKEEHL